MTKSAGSNKRSRSGRLREPATRKPSSRRCSSESHASDAEALHLGSRIPGACGSVGRKGLLEGVEGVRREIELDRLNVLYHPAPLLAARKRHEELPLRQEPRERQLRGRAVLACRQFTHALEQAQVVLQVLALEAGHVVPAIFRRERVRPRDRPGEKASAQ